MKTKLRFILFLQLFLWSGFSFAQHFQPVWNTPFNPMTIITIGATINGVPLVAGDEIGVFDSKTPTGTKYCVGSVTLSHSVSPEQYVQIICSMDDGTSPLNPNGFTQGHSFLYRYWKNSVNMEIADVHFDFPYSGFDQNFTALGTAIVSLSISATLPETHVINLNEGWTNISSYLIPQNSNVEQMFSAISGNLKIIQNLEGQYYQPLGNNSLINWDYQEGYFVKTDAALTLSLIGNPPASKQLYLKQGWNLLPVLSQVIVNISDLFLGQQNKVIMIKEAIGFKIFWPEKQISSLQMLEPGKSYLVYLNQETIVTF